ncbi:MAG: pyridoxamine 5'-phosphate oxidase family protein [Deltaproteobacteria bacterium]|nr:pyridoxamine 5'-phosphate oxidase family protein [Deltaproteobacteria bacterium]MBL7218182.1 pyridoxamine 5'-phosphate oxidase family protein [Desulfobacteraceae bacterium]
MRKRDEILHEGELEAQQRYAGENVWTETALNGMFKTEFNSATAIFVERQQFFFIATANDKGQCDASFRSTEMGSDGIMQPTVKVLSPSKLIFPDYSGNNLFNSLGNIIVNPNIGMLFIDFRNPMRLRINGSAEIIEKSNQYSEIWSTAHRYILVTVEQIYWNCTQRIPKLNLK